MKEYRLIGDEKELAKVIQENRIRIERGMIEFIPCSAEEADGKNVALFDSKDVIAEDKKEPKGKKNKNKATE